MEENNVIPPGPQGAAKPNVVVIRSTGYCAKVFMGLLMADRFFVVQKKRKEERERLGFIELEASDLEDDAKNCPIC